jgi:hypothetical protein
MTETDHDILVRELEAARDALDRAIQLLKASAAEKQEKDKRDGELLRSLLAYQKPLSRLTGH